MFRFLLPLLLVFGLGLAACGSGSSTSDGVLVEQVPTATPISADPVGGKPATPPAVVSPTAVANAVPAPTTGQWIDVDVTLYKVKLMNGTTVTRTIDQVAVGAQVDTGAYESTQTGLFYVYNKIPGLQYDPPYKTYIADWVGFDPAKANGFHSYLEDEKGNVVDSRSGRVSNGCIRTGDSQAIYSFAQVGMPVYVHH